MLRSVPRTGFWRPPRQNAMFLTGGSGFLGRHLARHPLVERWELIAPGSTLLDLRRREPVIEAIRDWRPQVVVHLAYRRDDRRSIVDASRNVAEAVAASAVDTRLVHVSSDVVFGGRAAPYVEPDPPDPATDYGRWKAEAESCVAAACPSAVLVRISLLYGTDLLSPHQLQVRRAAQGDPSTAYFTDEVRCPTHADDVAAAIFALAELRGVSGPLHAASPEPLDRAAFARHIAVWCGLDPAVLRTTTLAESGIARPGRVVLDVTRAAALGITCRPASEVLRPT